MNNVTPIVSVIVSTYNQPGFLFLVLTSLLEQDAKNFEVVIADDGSDDKTKKIIELIKSKAKYPIKHVWQQNSGFRAAMIRNKSAAFSAGDYLVFLDGDSVPPISFVSKHQRLAKKSYFVSGNRILLSQGFTDQQLLKQKGFLHRWKFLQWWYAYLRGGANCFLPILSLGNLYPRYLYTTRWQGVKTCNLGVWKKDFFAVNGFDESYRGWGYEDSDFVVRLINNGVFRKDGRFAIPVFHLWHPANNRDRERVNYQKLEDVIHSSRTKTVGGVEQYIKSE